jgi:glycosyltransferase involved in cell wall biosynthesis
MQAFGLQAQGIGRGQQAGTFAGPALAAQPLSCRRQIAGLPDWKLSGVWPQIGCGELHAYSGAATYGGDPRLAQRAAPILARAEAVPGVRLFAPLPRPDLQARLIQARCMLYLGDPGETFCLAVAEAQAAGLPCVVMDRGAVAERIEDGLTGVVARSEAEFIAAARGLMSDDSLWLRMHRAALARGPGPNWTDVARAFEALA